MNILNKNNIKKINTKKTKKFGRKYKIYLIIILFLMSLLLGRIAYIQSFQAAFLKEKAYEQLITSRVISTKRGTIYDSSGNQLAISSQVDTITINPKSIKVDSEDKEEAELKTKNLKEKVSKMLSEIFELNYEDTLKKVNSDNSIETIAQKVELEKVNKLKEWMKENKFYSGINIDSDTRRSYPYNNLASNLIGFCGNENHGLEGIEYYWDNVLSGTPRKNSNNKRCCSIYYSRQKRTIHSCRKWK